MISGERQTNMCRLLRPLPDILISRMIFSFNFSSTLSFNNSFFSVTRVYSVSKINFFSQISLDIKYAEVKAIKNHSLLFDALVLFTQNSV